MGNLGPAPAKRTQGTVERKTTGDTGRAATQHHFRIRMNASETLERSERRQPTAEIR